jgi:prevent-host-death family protein
MTAVPMRELRNHTSDILRRVQAGDDVTITQNGVPVAILVPVRTSLQQPIGRVALAKLILRQSPDFQLAADLDRLAGDTTDDLGPLP